MAPKARSHSRTRCPNADEFARAFHTAALVAERNEFRCAKSHGYPDQNRVQGHQTRIALLVGKFESDQVFGDNMMILIPTKQTATPSKSQRFGLIPSTTQSHRIAMVI